MGMGGLINLPDKLLGVNSVMTFRIRFSIGNAQESIVLCPCLFTY
ncbi:MAG: hypothetical protein ACJAXJ_004365 [Colwellia sp.]|jgi:hypothetical protein